MLKIFKRRVLKQKPQIKLMKTVNKNLWYFKVEDSKGDILLCSETFPDYQKMISHIEKLRVAINSANIVDHSI